MIRRDGRLNKNSIKIAVVDDDFAVREATSGLLRASGYCAVSFPSAEAFLNSCERQNTSCVVSDVRMHGMSGLDLQERLLAEQNRIPIIFVTAFPEPAIRERAISAGARGYLTKPYNDDMLIQMIASAVRV